MTLICTFSLLNVPLKYQNYAVYGRVARTPMKVDTFILPFFQASSVWNIYALHQHGLHLFPGETPSFQGVRVWAVEDPRSSLILQDSSGSVAEHPVRLRDYNYLVVRRERFGARGIHLPYIFPIQWGAKELL